MRNTPHLHRFAAILAVLLSTGCAVNVNLNANRLESPETAGGFSRGSIDAGLSGSNTLIVGPGTQGWDRSNASARLSGSFGLLERLDLELKVPWNSPVLLQAKYQFLGAPFSHAKSGNFSLAATAAAGLTQPNQDGTSLTLAAYDASLIAGLRIAETWMIYGGGFMTTTRYSGATIQTGATNGAFQGSATQGGANLGLQLDSVLGALKIEEAWAQAWGQAGIEQSGFYTGASLSARF